MNVFAQLVLAAGGTAGLRENGLGGIEDDVGRDRDRLQIDQGHGRFLWLAATSSMVDVRLSRRTVRYLGIYLGMYI